jgi:hypothetical protein
MSTVCNGRNVLAFILISTLIACGGGGGSTGSNTSTYYRELAVPAGSTQGYGTVTAVSDTGIAVGSGRVSVAGFFGEAALFWEGSLCRMIAVPSPFTTMARFDAVSPSGTWMAGTCELLEAGVRKARFFRYNKATDTVTLAPDPLVGVYSSVLVRTVDESGTVHVDGYTPADNRLVTWNADNSIDFVIGTRFGGLALGEPSGTVLVSAIGISQNLRYVCGEVTHPGGSGLISEGIVWDLSTNSYRLCGLFGIENTQAVAVSNDGLSALIRSVTTGGYAVWTSGSIELSTTMVHRNGFGTNWNFIMTSAISPNGKLFAGSVGSTFNVTSKSFVYQQ